MRPKHPYADGTTFTWIPYGETYAIERWNDSADAYDVRVSDGAYTALTHEGIERLVADGAFKILTSPPHALTKHDDATDPQRSDTGEYTVTMQNGSTYAFTIHDDTPNVKQDTCTCETRALFNFGCKCGHLMRTRL